MLSLLGAGLAGYGQWQSDAGDYSGGARVARAVARGAIVGAFAVGAGVLGGLACGAISFGEKAANWLLPE